MAAPPKPVTATRTYPGLANQDTQYIPKTIQDGGNSMTLQTVNWQTEGDGHFTAMASYSGLRHQFLCEGLYRHRRLRRHREPYQPE